LLVAGAVVGTAAGVVGAAWSAQRAFVAAARRRSHSDAAETIEFHFDEVLDIPSHDRGSIRVYSRGEGPPILFSHGVTLSSRTWAKQFEALPEMGFRVVAFDHRGHGASQLGEHGHAVINIGADVATVMRKLDLRNAVLVGHSMGGLGVQAFALEYPEEIAARVRGIGLLSTMTRTRSLGPVAFREALSAGVRNGPSLGSVMQMPNFGYLVARLGFGKNPQPEHVDFTREMIAECPAETSHQATEALLDTDFTGDLPTIDVPMLIVCGSADLITPPQDSRRIARRVPGARLVIVPGAGHMVMLEESDAFNELIASFATEVQIRHTKGKVASTARKRP
jgi:3-oxoadipate enol-lactonase